MWGVNGHKFARNERNMDTTLNVRVAHAAMMATTVVIAAVVAAQVAQVAATKRPASGPGRGNPGVKRARKRRGNPWESSYAQVLLAPDVEDPEARDGKRFRKCFRVTFAVYKSLLLIARGMPYWVSKKPKDATGVDRHPLEM
jgi:hypothetical protein